MFERNRVDNSADKSAAAAQIQLDDGRRISGRFLIARSKSLIDVLNGPAQFIEFEPYDGEVEVIAKSSIRSLRMTSVSKVRNPTHLIKDTDHFDPFEILGVEKGASRAEIRSAFHKQSMTYHPDRYSTAELPQEVTSYLEQMARRINAAHDVLAEQAANAEAFVDQRQEPVFTSRPAA